MSELPDEGDESNQLPAERLCNRKGMGGKQNCPPNIRGDGALGNQMTGRMYYSGKGKDGKDDKKKLVEILQRMLKTLGYDLGTTGHEGDGVDGKFGDLTEDAVKKFQEDHKDWDGEPLKVDGLVGPRTSDSLNREMVGIWYVEYETPKELTESFILVTATQDALENGISIGSEGMKSAKVVLVGLDEHVITLYDSSGNRFSFEGEGKFMVLDEMENQLAEGIMRREEDIKLKSVKPPYMVELSVDGDIFTFFV
jgi:hypothetical protein